MKDATVDYLDIWNRGELPPPQPGHRYLDFIGGTRELRCFAVPGDMPRSRFMEDHADLLDEALLPIYDRDGIRVRQDASYPVPGFYIVSHVQQFPSIDAIPEPLYLRMASIIRQARAAMREALGIRYVHMHYEEKPDASCNVHHWLLPIYDPTPQQPEVIMRLDLMGYLRRFKFVQERATILDFNDRMRTRLASLDQNRQGQT